MLTNAQASEETFETTGSLRHDISHETSLLSRRVAHTPHTLPPKSSGVDWISCHMLQGRTRSTGPRGSNKQKHQLVDVSKRPAVGNITPPGRQRGLGAVRNAPSVT